MAFYHFYVYNCVDDVVDDDVEVDDAEYDVDEHVDDVGDAGGVEDVNMMDHLGQRCMLSIVSALQIQISAA